MLKNILIITYWHLPLCSIHLLGKNKYVCMFWLPDLWEWNYT